MKKLHAGILLLTIACLCFVGCRSTHADTNIPVETTYPRIQYSVYTADPPEEEYINIASLVADADYVILGTVTDISYEVYQSRPDIPDSYRIRILYTIAVSQYYKGSGDETVTLAVSQFMKNDQELRKLAWEYGIQRIAVRYPHTQELDIGDTYALVLCESEDGRLAHINRTQYAYNAKKASVPISGISFNDFLEYYRIEEEN